jgi:transposase InsO family protein
MEACVDYVPIPAAFPSVSWVAIRDAFDLDNRDPVFLARNAQAKSKNRVHNNSQWRLQLTLALFHSCLVLLRRCADDTGRRAQNFAAGRPNEVWLADITYVPTGKGWLYLAVVLDLFTRKSVGWAMCDHMGAELMGP